MIPTRTQIGVKLLNCNRLKFSPTRGEPHVLDHHQSRHPQRATGFLVGSLCNPPKATPTRSCPSPLPPPPPLTPPPSLPSPTPCHHRRCRHCRRGCRVCRSSSGKLRIASGDGVDPTSDENGMDDLMSLVPLVGRLVGLWVLWS